MVNNKYILLITFLTFSFSFVSAFDFPHTVVTIDYSGNLTNISQMQDVDTSGATNGQALVWNSGTSKWEPLTIEGISDTNETTRFDALTDTDCGAGYLVIGIQSNGTVLCAEDSGEGGNSSWNQSLADTLYISQLDESNLDVNSADNWDSYDDVNTTQFENNDGTLSILISWFSSQFDSLFGTKDTDDLTQGSTNLYDNQSWTEAVADEKYALIGAGADNSSWNESYADTLYADISVVDTNCSEDGSCGLITYDSELDYYTDSDIDGSESAFDGWDKNSGDDFDGSWNSLTDIPAGFSDGVDNQSTGGADWSEITSIPAGFDDDIDNDTTYSDLSEFNNDVGFYDSESDLTTLLDDNYADISVTGDNSSWNESYADTLYADISVVDTDDQTCAEVSGCIENAITDGNTGWDNSYGFWNDTYATFNKTYADTLYADISVTGDNSSWNESYANTLYADISVVDTDTTYDAGSNLTLTETTFSLDVDGILVWLDTLFTRTTNLVSLLGNWSADKGDYSTTAEADLLYAPISVTGDNSSWNESYADTKYYDSESDLTTLLDDNYAPINYGDDWNETYADTLYAPISVTGGSSFDQDLNTTDDVIFNSVNVSTNLSANEIQLNTGGRIYYNGTDNIWDFS